MAVVAATRRDVFIPSAYPHCFRKKHHAGWPRPSLIVRLVAWPVGAVPTWATGPARPTGSGVPFRSTGPARRRSARSPSRSPVRVGMGVGSGSPPIVVAAVPVPVGTPDRVPEVSRAPLRERAGLCFGVGRGGQASQPETGGDDGCCCGYACDFFHSALVPNEPMCEICMAIEIPWPPTLITTKEGEVNYVTAQSTTRRRSLFLAVGTPEDVSRFQLGSADLGRAHPAWFTSAPIHIGSRSPGRI
jgi:hypothetical protein